MANPPDKSNPHRLKEFAHLSSYWDAGQGIHIVRIMAGDYYVTRCQEGISTVLGSCVTACIRDPIIGIGGMNHFMLPAESDTDSHWRQLGLGAGARYGDFAMEQLINSVLKHGGRRNYLEIKIFGGGRIMGGMVDVGERNIQFVREFLNTEGLTISAEDVGGEYSRRMVYFPHSGKVLVKKLKVSRDDAVLRQEKAYLNDLKRKTHDDGEVELFND